MTRDRKAYMRKYQNEWIKKRRAAWFEERGVCIQCGSNEQLEVHHTNPEKKVTHAVWSWSKERMTEELQKCIPLCHSCHLKATGLYFTKPLVHGTVFGYNKKKCRCEACKAAKAAWRKGGPYTGVATQVLPGK